MLRGPLLLAAACLLAPASALRVAAPLAQPRVASPIMAMPSIDDAKNLSEDELLAEINNAKKELFMMRKNVKTRQQVKPHLFTHTKHRVAQLQTLLTQRQSS